MTGWSVMVEARAPEGAGPITNWEQAAEWLLAAVEPFHGVAAVGPDRYEARISVAAAGIDRAKDDAVSWIGRAFAFARLPMWPVVRVEVVREDVLAEELLRT